MRIDYNDQSKEELIKIIKQMDDKLLEQAQCIHTLSELLSLYQGRQFGRSTETAASQQLGIFDEAEPPKNPEAIEKADEEIHVASYKRQKKSPGRKPLPADLPRTTLTYDIPEEKKICSCGCELVHIKDEKCEQLEIIPAKIFVIEHIKKKYACRVCESTILTAEMPAQPIPRSIAAPGLLSHVVVSKFEDHLPFSSEAPVITFRKNMPQIVYK